jgi:pre-rRNA-processing protein TSR4
MPASGLGESIFGVKPTGGAQLPSNPFSASSNPNPFSMKAPVASSNPFSSVPSGQSSRPSASPSEAVETLPKTFASALSLNNDQLTSAPAPAPQPPEPWPPGADQPLPFPVMWIADAEYEILDPTPETKISTKDTMDMDDAAPGNGKEDKEVFESSMDSAFQKFADRVGQNPEQVIRYEFGGQPLLYSKDDATGRMLSKGSAGMTRCGNCGSRRVFEVQMAPHAIAEMEAEEDGLDGMDWGTIIVGVCEADCVERGIADGEASYLEEWVAVQWEELSAKR